MPKNQAFVNVDKIYGGTCLKIAFSRGVICFGEKHSKNPLFLALEEGINFVKKLIFPADFLLFLQYLLHPW